MANTYTIAQLDSIIAGLEANLQSPLEIRHGDKSETGRSEQEIRSSIAYFQAQYNNASDAPPISSPKVRTYFVHGSKGFGI